MLASSLAIKQVKHLVRVKFTVPSGVSDSIGAFTCTETRLLLFIKHAVLRAGPSCGGGPWASQRGGESPSKLYEELLRNYSIVTYA